MGIQQIDLPPHIVKTGKHAGTIIDRYRQDLWTSFRIYYRRAGTSGPWSCSINAALRAR